MQIKKTFYRAFEDRHRGSRDLIKERLRAYLPFLEAFLTVYTPAETLDIGCGRGEWLELLTEFGFMPSGIDLDNGMLEACHALGLNAIQGDGIEHLRAMADESQVVISAFHVVEHIAFEQLQILAAEAHRVLKPGGLLIMETPNPENIIVATRNFYLDPTHIRPIPPDLLSFVAEYAGFARVKTLRLQESKELIKKESLNLQEVLSGASPDYAIVAQKEASHAVLKLTDDAFSREYGLSLENLLGRWDERVERISDKANHAEAQTEQVKEHIDSLMTQTFNVVAQAESAITQSIHAIDRSNHAEAQATQASERANHAEAQAAQANERAHALWLQLEALLNSRSWRITAPLRKLKNLLKSWHRS